MDLDWVRRAAEGDLEAMEALYNRYKPMVFSVGLAICGNRSDADEVVQETFLRIFRKLDQWREKSQFGTWLYTAALRTAQNWKSRFLARRPVPVASSASVDEDPYEELMAAIQELPEQQRLTVLMKHLQGLRIREIAAIQGCAEGTVKANLHHAICALLRKLEREPE